MEDKILEVLKNYNKALSVFEIEEQLNIDKNSIESLLETLKKLEDEVKVYKTNKGNYVLFNNSHLKIGKFIGNKKGFGFVDIEGDEDVFIAVNNINGAIHGDKVVVEITSKKGTDLEGRILKIAERSLKTIVGEFYYAKGVGYVKPDDNKINMKIIIDKKSTKGAMNGHKVVVELVKKISNIEHLGIITKILGHKNDPGVDILSICAKYFINDVFSEELMDEVNKIPNEVLKSEIGNRTDLRDTEIFTIDGDDTKDIDDAISLKILENGNYYLGVHIADVSHYVKEGSIIDLEAYDRGTSVYLADRVIPMLPHKLSNGICSLNPNVDRLAVSCEMEIDNHGNIVDYKIFESIINSKKQMTYKNVNKIYDENIVPDGYEEFKDTLLKMKDLASILRKHKEKRGYIDFDLDESKIIVNEEGEAVDIVLRERGTGEKLIEDFMIAANETVATSIYFMELPFVYRVHGTPKEEKITSFLSFVSLLGYKVNAKIKTITPKVMQSILEELKEKKEFHILSALLLRSMQKAVYDKQNIGHFGLASKYYTHFTSPIRRYPDTTVHRLIRTYLFNNQINSDVIKYWDNKLGPLTEHSSMKERDSINCEREVDDMKKAEYMEKHIGEKYKGIINGVMSFGFFVELPNLVEGLVRVENIKGDFYTFDESTMSLIGKNNKRGFRLGDSVTVKVIAASKENKTVDFILTNDLGEEK